MDKLAIDGGKPVRSKPLPPRIIYDEKEKKAALRVIEKTMSGPEAIDLYGGGEEVSAYREEFAKYFGVKFAATVTSGTAAVHTAIAALRLEPGSEIITSPITDPGTVAPILMQNCVPVFSDVDYETINITAPEIEKKITKKTKAIIAVHLAGQPCDMGPIMELAKKHKLYVIEDSAQAHGSIYKGKYVGSIGDLGSFSLMAGKHMNSGGQGGMVTTNNEEFYWNARRFADRGKPFGTQETTNIALGLNYRITELQAAIGRVQLTKLAGIKEKRRKIVSELEKQMKAAGLKSVKLWKIIEGTEMNPWFSFIRYDHNIMKATKQEFVNALVKEGIGAASTHYTVVLYKQKWIKEKTTYGNSHYPWSLGNYDNPDGTCPNAEKALADHFTLYTHECWTKKEVEDTVEAMVKVEKAYLK